jgi:hypothetical protein
LDKIDKVLLIMPLLPIADLVSTLFCLSFSGGEEIGILARPMLQNHGPYGLVMLAIAASIIFLAFMKVAIYIKKLFIEEWKIKWMRYFLTIQIYWFFILEAVYASTVIMNFLAPMYPLLTQTIILRAVLICTYFSCVSALTMPQIRQLPHF